jgi:hypothetical protein
MNSKFKKVLAALVCVAMLAGFATVFAASADGIDWTSFEDQSVDFTVGEEFTAVIDLGEDTTTHGEASWGYISVVQTNLMEDEDNEEYEAGEDYTVSVASVKADGEDVPFTVANIDLSFEDGVRVILTNGWSDTPFIAKGAIEEFSKLEVTLTISLVEGSDADTSGKAWIAGTYGEPGEGNGGAENIPGDATINADGSFSGAYAWIGGTFYLEDEESVEWTEFADQKVSVNLGTKFTAVLDMGDDEIEHDEASWGGWITVVQTNIRGGASTADKYDAIIHSIKVDGAEVSFNADNVVAGYDKGLRTHLTSMWASDEGNPVLSSIGEIGKFSKLEVEMEFVLAEGSDTSDPASTSPPTTNAPSGDDDDDDGIPVWVFIAIGAGVVALIVIIAVVAKKKG